MSVIDDIGRGANRIRRFLAGSKLAAWTGGETPESIHPLRVATAGRFIRGDGIEIGALHRPLAVPAEARVTFVDRMKVDSLRRQYPELAREPLVSVNVVDDGETLATIGDRTQDFVIANHFIEHCQNPLKAFQSFFRVLKDGGVAYLAVPDKRFTFDIDRPCTSLEHVIRDFDEGPAWSKRAHFEEWSHLVDKHTGRDEIQSEATRLMAIDYSIHFHVWRAKEFLELMAEVVRRNEFELEAFLRNGPETIVVLRK
jgi:SAM-dependent methyltransferase